MNSSDLRLNPIQVSKREKKASKKANKRGKESQLLGGATVLRAFELFSALTAAGVVCKGMKKSYPNRHTHPPSPTGRRRAQTRKPTTIWFTVLIFI